MIDHVGIPVSDYEKSKAFYTKALAPLGVTMIVEVPGNLTESKAPACGFGRNGNPNFWIGGEGGVGKNPLHIAIVAESRAAVDAFHAAALVAGGRDNGAPGIRARYHPDYYAAFVLDPDGQNVEAVCHGAGAGNEGQTVYA